jgi:hypothetical protein
MSTANSRPSFVANPGEPALFDSLARLVPKELQASYYRVLAHTRTLSPDDEMLRILEAMASWPCLRVILRKKSRRSESCFRKCSPDSSSARTRLRRRWSNIYMGSRRASPLSPMKLKTS